MGRNKVPSSMLLASHWHHPQNLGGTAFKHPHGTFLPSANTLSVVIGMSTAQRRNVFVCLEMIRAAKSIKCPSSSFPSPHLPSCTQAFTPSFNQPANQKVKTSLTGHLLHQPVHGSALWETQRWRRQVSGPEDLTVLLPLLRSLHP